MEFVRFHNDCRFNTHCRCMPSLNHNHTRLQMGLSTIQTRRLALVLRKMMARLAEMVNGATCPAVSAAGKVSHSF